MWNPGNPSSADHMQAAEDNRAEKCSAELRECKKALAAERERGDALQAELDELKHQIRQFADGLVARHG